MRETVGIPLIQAFRTSAPAGGTAAPTGSGWRCRTLPVAGIATERGVGNPQGSRPSRDGSDATAGSGYSFGTAPGSNRHLHKTARRSPVARGRTPGGPGVQRDPLQLGTVHHQPARIPPSSENSVAKNCAGGLRDSARDRAERVPDPGHRVAVRPCRTPHGRQHHPPPWRPPLFRAVPGSPDSVGMVVSAPGAAGDAKMNCLITR